MTTKLKTRKTKTQPQAKESIPMSVETLPLFEDQISGSAKAEEAPAEVSGPQKTARKPRTVAPVGKAPFQYIAVEFLVPNGLYDAETFSKDLASMALNDFPAAQYTAHRISDAVIQRKRIK